MRRPAHAERRIFHASGPTSLRPGPTGKDKNEPRETEKNSRDAERVKLFFADTKQMRPPSTGTDCGQNADRTHAAGSCRRQRLTSPPPERLRRRGGQNALRRNTHEDRRDAPPWGPPQNPVTPERHPTTRNASRLPHRGVRPTARRHRDATHRHRPVPVPAPVSAPAPASSSGLQFRSPAPPPGPVRPQA